MAINKAMMLALKTLSYQEPDLKKNYKLPKRFVHVKRAYEVINKFLSEE